MRYPTRESVSETLEAAAGGILMGLTVGPVNFHAVESCLDGILRGFSVQLDKLANLRYC